MAKKVISVKIDKKSSTSDTKCLKSICDRCNIIKIVVFGVKYPDPHKWRVQNVTSM